MALPATFILAQHFDEAFERIGRDPSSITPAMLQSARRSVRLLLDEWNNDSVDFWKVLDGQTNTVTEDDTTFTPTSGTIDILRANVKRDDIETPMLIISASDWFNIPDKTAPGMPDRIWVERYGTTITAHFWPVAENSTDVIVYDAMARFEDSSTLSSAVDVPPLWLEAFTAGLAAKLAEKYAPERLSEKMQLAGGPGIPTGKYAIARMGNRERGDTVMRMARTRRPR